MKKVLKIIAIVLVIIALLIIAIGVASHYMAGGTNLLAEWGVSGWLGSLSATGLIVLGAAGLVLAAIISPKGFAKGFDRVTGAVGAVVGGVAKMAKKGLEAAWDGVMPDFLKGKLKWLWIIGGAALVYALWPDASERAERARARADRLRAEREEREQALLLKNLEETKGHVEG